MGHTVDIDARPPHRKTALPLSSIVYCVMLPEPCSCAVARGSHGMHYGNSTS